MKFKPFLIIFIVKYHIIKKGTLFMKLYILNMKTDIARKEFILDQLNILKIKNYEFVEAVNVKKHFYTQIFIQTSIFSK
jgi:hypothetical protein